MIDFIRNKTVLPPIKIGDQVFTEVIRRNLIGIWFDDDLHEVCHGYGIYYKEGYLKTLLTY